MNQNNSLHSPKWAQFILLEWNKARKRREVYSARSPIKNTFILIQIKKVMRNKTTRNLTAEEKNMPYSILADPTKKVYAHIRTKSINITFME